MSEAAAAPSEVKPGGPPEYDESIVHVVAAKVLVDWLRNRQQLLVPFKLDLQKLEKPPADVLIDLVAVAALADGAGGERARARVETTLALANATEAHRAAARAALEQPKPLSTLLAGIEDLPAAAVAYAACLLALDRAGPANRQFARYLAARLKLPQQLARDVEQRYRAPLVAQKALN